ncbi:MAG: flagellar hook-basal body protein [Rhizobacter sp.]
MADALSIAATSMGFDMVKLASLSNNLANATTPAFRREIVYGRPFAQLLESGARANALALGVPEPQLAFDPLQGTLRATGAPLDVALQGEGWFEVGTPEGPAYTRQGDFQLDARGRLVAHGGLPVQGLGGELTFGGGALRIDDQGRVFEDGRPAGQLRVVRFQRQSGLEPLGGGLYRASAEAGSTVATPQVRQGFLESSNVTTANEMVRLIETMRHFEANQKLIQSYDDSLGRVIRTLGEF